MAKTQAQLQKELEEELLYRQTGQLPTNLEQQIADRNVALGRPADYRPPEPPPQFNPLPSAAAPPPQPTMSIQPVLPAQPTLGPPTNPFAGPQPKIVSATPLSEFDQSTQLIKAAAPLDYAKILEEAERQKQLGSEYAGVYADKRRTALEDLSTLLAQQQNRQLQLQVPELAEQANLKGIFRSTGLGNSIGREAGRLAATTSEQLALQGLQDRSANLTDLSNVDQGYLGGRYSALQRGFSLQDLARQAEIAKTTGAVLQPTPQATPSAKGGSALQGGLGGAGIGGQVGGVPGAIIGGIGGAIGGGQASKGK